MKIDSVLANSADPDEMLHNAAFHLGLYCLSKCLFRQSTHLGVSGLQKVKLSNTFLSLFSSTVFDLISGLYRLLSEA